MTVTDILNRFQEQHIMIIGDVMLDRYLYGSVTRISPEAPVPVVDFEKTEHRLGGAANVALNVLALGGRVSLVGMIGNDEEGKIFQDLLLTSEISDRWLYSHSNRCTTLKTRVMARTHHLLRVDREDRSYLEQAAEKSILTTIMEAIRMEKPNGIILQDYNKGMLTPDVIEKIINQARLYDIPVFIDPKIDNIQSYKNCTVFKPNLHEAEKILGRRVSVNSEDLESAVKELQALVHPELTMITLSDKGLYLKRKNGSGVYIPSIPQEVADVCGAGDSVISVLAMSYLTGCNDEILGKISNIAGHIACRYPGVVPIGIEQLKSEMIY